MEILRVFLLIVEVATSVLLIGIILLQKTKGGGMGGALGGGMGEAIFGAQMGNVLTKITVVLAVMFLVNTTVLALIISKKTSTPRIGSETAPVTAPMIPGTQAVPSSSTAVPAVNTPGASTVDSGASVALPPVTVPVEAPVPAPASP